MMVEVALAVVVERRKIARDSERRVLFQYRLGILLCRRLIIHLGVGCGKERIVGMIGRRNTLERLGRLGISPRHVKTPAQVTTETLGKIRVEAHRFLDPFDALFRLPQPGQDLALLHDDEVVVGIEAERPPLMIGRLIKIAVRQIYRGKNTVDVTVVVIESEGDLQLCGYFLPGRIAVFAPAVDPILGQRTGLPGMGKGILGVELDRPIQQALRLLLSALLERWWRTLPAITNS